MAIKKYTELLSEPLKLMRVQLHAHYEDAYFQDDKQGMNEVIPGLELLDEIMSSNAFRRTQEFYADKVLSEEALNGGEI